MGHGNYFSKIGIFIIELNSWSGRDQLIIIDILMKSRCLKVHQTKKIPCTSEIWYHSSISCNTENYGNFELSHSRLFKNDADPDIQFYNNHYFGSLQACDFYLENMFNDKIKKSKISNQSFSVLPMNIRSMQKKSWVTWKLPWNIGS